MPEKHSQRPLQAVAHEGGGVFADLVNVELRPAQTYNMGFCFERLRKKKFLRNSCPVSPASLSSFCICRYEPRVGDTARVFMCSFMESI
jgi:hypothetical protein